MGFPRQEYGSGLPFPPPGDLPDAGIEPGFPAPPALSHLGSPLSRYSFLSHFIHHDDNMRSKLNDLPPSPARQSLTSGVKRVFTDNSEWRGAHTPWMALDPEASVLAVARGAHRRGPEKTEPEQRPRRRRPSPEPREPGSGAGTETLGASRGTRSPAALTLLWPQNGGRPRCCRLNLPGSRDMLWWPQDSVQDPGEEKRPVSSKEGSCPKARACKAPAS